MKIILLFFLLLLPSICKAQEPLTIDSVVNVQEKDAQTIYEAISKWIATNIDVKSAQTVVTTDDNKRSVTTKAVIKFEVKNFTWAAMSGVIYCTIDVTARDGRYRIRFTDFVHDSSTRDQITGTWDEGLIYETIPDERNKGLGGKQHREVYKRANQRIDEWTKQQIDALTKYINSFTKLEEEDW